MTVYDLLKLANLTPCGPKPWKSEIDDDQAGIYIIVTDTQLSDCPLCDEKSAKLSGPLRERELDKWIPNQEVLYIGKTKRSLRKRLAEFYRHKHGSKSPHRGGQAVHLLNGCLMVYWAHSDAPECDEARLLFHFRSKLGRLPYANRKDSDRRWLACIKSLSK